MALTDVHQTALVPASPSGGDGHEHRFTPHCVRPYRPESAGVRQRQAASVDLSSAAHDEAAAGDEGQGDDAGTQGGAGAGQWPAARATGAASLRGGSTRPARGSWQATRTDRSRGCVTTASGCDPRLPLREPATNASRRGRRSRLGAGRGRGRRRSTRRRPAATGRRGSGRRSTGGSRLRAGSGRRRRRGLPIRRDLEVEAVENLAGSVDGLQGHPAAGRGGWR